MRAGLIRGVLAFAIVVSVVGTGAHASSVTVARCQADYGELLAVLERNRLAAIEETNENLDGVTDTVVRAQLLEMIELAWDEEEEQRAIADNIRRDCLAAVK